MTLSLAIHNSKNIVLISDSMGIETLYDGTEIIHNDTKKIYKINSYSAFSIAGNFDTNMVFRVLEELLKRLKYQKLCIDQIFEYSFIFLGRNLLYLDPDDKLEVIFAGYTEDGVPKLITLMKNNGKINRYQPMSEFYDMIGFKKPQLLAKDIMEQRGVNLDSKSSLLKRASLEIMRKSIQMYPGMTGGKPRMVMLKKPRI